MIRSVSAYKYKLIDITKEAVERDFEFAYLKGNKFILVRYDDFDP